MLIITEQWYYSGSRLSVCEIVGGLGFVRILFIFNIWQYSVIFKGILGLKMDVCGLCFTVAVVYVQIKLRALAFSSAIAPHGGRHSECARNGEAGDSPRVFSGRLAVFFWLFFWFFLQSPKPHHFVPSHVLHRSASLHGSSRATTQIVGT